MDWKSLFPNARLSRRFATETDMITVPYKKSWLQIPKADLTERELAFLQLLLEEEAWQEKKSPWASFLLGDSQVQPEQYLTYQFLHIQHSQDLSQDLLQLLGDLLMGQVALIQTERNRTALLLVEDQGGDFLLLLRELLATIESDFGLSLEVFLGNSWSQLDSESLPSIFQAEMALFTDFIAGHSSEKVQSFSKIMLWALSNNRGGGIFKEKLKSYLSQQSEMVDVIHALWESHGNQVQAAQMLYLHRNSLQYKMDKFQRLSGLNLKKLDDLALCYWLLLEG